MKSPKAMEESRLSRWETLARWNTILFIPVSAVGLLLIAWSTHALPVGFRYVGFVLAPAVFVMGEPFGGGGLRLAAAGLTQWVRCLLLMGIYRRVRCRNVSVSIDV